jgi:hypothetical protein
MGIMTEAPAYEGEIGFENMPKGCIEIKISIKESRDYRIRMWLMRHVTAIYFRVMAGLSKGATVGVLEV